MDKYNFKKKTNTKHPTLQTKRYSFSSRTTISNNNQRIYQEQKVVILKRSEKSDK